jgi:hypothetical protein
MILQEDGTRPQRYLLGQWESTLFGGLVSLVVAQSCPGAVTDRFSSKNGGFPAIAATCNLAPETGWIRSLRSGLAGTVEALGVQLPSSLGPFPLGAFEP